MTRTNIHVTLFKTFTYHGIRHKDVLMFCFNGDDRWPFYLLPQDGGTFKTLCGQNHIRGATLGWINEIFGHKWVMNDRYFTDYGRIVEYFKGWKNTEFKETGIYK